MKTEQKIKIWYYKKSIARDVPFWYGFDYNKQEVLTHVRNTFPHEYDLVFETEWIQDENPKHQLDLSEKEIINTYNELWFKRLNLEPQEYISNKECRHTSMSVGDIIEIDGNVYICASCGFIEISKEQLKGEL